MSGYVFVLCLISLLLGFVYVMAQKGIKRKDEQYNDDDTALIQELNRSLVRMEQRLEALETLLADQPNPQRPPTYREVMREREKADL